MFGSKINPSGAANDLGDEIANSLRLNDDDTARLEKTFSGAGTSRRTKTISAWIKQCSTKEQHILSTQDGGSDTGERFYITSSGQLAYLNRSSGTTLDLVVTTRVLRDASSWTHVCAIIDTTEATASDRVKFYINGVQDTDLSSTNYPTLNHDGFIGHSVLHRVGCHPGYSSVNDHADMYITGLILVDGQALSPTNFGRFSASHPNVWVPITPSGITYGSNGFYLDFAVAPGTGNGAGTDVSGNGNHFTDFNLNPEDQLSDTPTDNYCTLNSLTGVNSGSSVVTHADGNLQATQAANYVGTFGTVAANSGKYYFEYSYAADALYADGRLFGGVVCVETAHHGYFRIDGGSFYLPDKTTEGNYMVRHRSGTGQQSNTGSSLSAYNTNLSSSSATGGPESGPDIYMVAMDLDNGNLYWGKNGTWYGASSTSGSDYTDATPIAIISAHQGKYFAPAFYWSGAASGTTTVLNCGQDATFGGRYSSPAGDFYYTPPTGFSALSTANLPTPLVTNPEQAFITTKATETNIVSSMASARSDWGSDYVDILKNSSSIEAWLYRFGADSSNEFVAPVGSYPSYSATYQANSTLSGSDNWQGHSIRIGAEYLTAAGTIAHTSGAATTITHNLATDRYCVLLFEQSTTKDVWFHHPDFSAGNLLKFVKDEALTASTQITNIGSNSCDIGSGAATGTYSYFIFADGGIASMGKYTGNGNADGPFIDAAHAPGFFSRRSGGARNFWSNHAKTPGFNENDHYTRWNSPQAEGSPSLKIDLLSTGIKIRDTYADQNTNSEVYYWFSFGYSAIGGGIPFPNAR